MKSKEKEYLEALEAIGVLLFDIIEDFEEGDDDISHFLENLYDVLDKVIPM